MSRSNSKSLRPRHWGKSKVKDLDSGEKFKTSTLGEIVSLEKSNKNVIDNKCIVLSSDFKLPDENHVLLRVPRENNMYNVDLKNIVPSGNQPNHNAGIQENLDAGTVGKEAKFVQQYVLLPLWSSGSKDPHNTDANATFEVKESDTNGVNAVSTPVTAVGLNSTNSTNSFNAAGPSDNVVSPTFEIDDEEDVGAEADFSNLDTTPQTRSMTRMVKDQGGLTQINDKDFHTCMFACFLSQEEPKRVHQALKDPSWMEAMQEEFLQFKMQKVWVLVDLPKGFKDLDYPDKVYKVVKALYGLHQASRAWYETLANYLLENGFQRGKIDQTLFIKKQNEKEDGIFISQDKYVAKILRKFGLTNRKSAGTPIDTEKPLLKDPDSEDVDVHTYRSMIGSLMYLTSSRPDIMFAVYACARFQVTPKVSHLHAVKRIFRYLKGKPHLCLWYPKDSPLNLVAYSDSDYAGASLDRKSTTRDCQFLEDQPLPTDASPTALSPGYVVDFDPKKDEEDPKEDPADREDNDDDESSNDDDDDDDVEKDEEDEEEEEHLAPTDPFDVSTDDLETMTTVNQGMGVEKIKRVVAQRVANANEAIAIYEIKTNMALKSMSQTERQEEKVAENASNKRKWEGNHNGSSSQQNKGICWISTSVKPATAKNQRTRTCYECGSLRYYKSECTIVKFQKRVDMIHGGVRASKPKTMQDATKIATKLMNKKISTLVVRQAENKRKLANTSKNNQNQQQPNKRQNTGRAYTAWYGEKKHYSGSTPLCSKCNYHHDGPCAPKCHKCNRVGHLARDCRSSTNANTTNIHKSTRASQKATCYECRNQGHYRRDCLE
nr:hypothetical protein [Tanacetum cinerariifolium]